MTQLEIELESPKGKRMTNRQRLVSFLRQEGSITVLEGAFKLKPPMTSVSQEITRLERSGYVFEHIDEKDEWTHWTRYKLVSEPKR